MKNPVVKKNISNTEMEELEKIFKSERTSGKEQFNLQNEPELEIMQEKDNEDSLIEDEVVQSRKEYLESVSKK